ncbi:MAG: acetylglutamate kinase [candidate division KSB1 bacterium]|nr:acetylglutamate kinase [candidate division KSB1 bacterium]MDZ7333939.1 acetylglutamate kinase [candidate division KSB1 bacterium]MDZ7358522.1 acetylglutamate kinase [candidate division KSB1 bacterium]MDZ7375166.1 acetylglutamate kinase [candidate division KSB1 bacterium]MDZ7399185.1 acetylglutamate kinase [candidate division KSB1 bacterium]
MNRSKILLKIGGKAFDGESAYQELAQEQLLLKDIAFIIVHGGGAEISQALKAANRQSVFVDGLRVTSAEDIAIVEQVLSGTINERIARLLSRNGLSCRRLSGKTEGLLLVEPMRRNGKDLGFVGRIKQVNPSPVLESLNQHRVPIISPISADEAGDSYNVNADSAAAAIASACQCAGLIYFTDVPGVKVGDKILSQINYSQAKKLIADGVIKDGMIAKLESAFEALLNHVPWVHITSWQGPGTLRNLIERRAKSGTTIYG